MTREEAAALLQHWIGLALDERSTDIPGDTRELVQAFDVLGLGRPQALVDFSEKFYPTDPIGAKP